MPTEKSAINCRLPIVFNRKPKYCHFQRDTWNLVLVGDAHPTLKHWNSYTAMLGLKSRQGIAGAEAHRC